MNAPISRKLIVRKVTRVMLPLNETNREIIHIVSAADLYSFRILTFGIFRIMYSS